MSGPGYGAWLLRTWRWLEVSLDDADDNPDRLVVRRNRKQRARSGIRRDLPPGMKLMAVSEERRHFLRPQPLARTVVDGVAPVLAGATPTNPSWASPPPAGHMASASDVGRCETPVSPVANAVPRLATRVVFPTPPFRLRKATSRT